MPNSLSFSKAMERKASNIEKWKFFIFGILLGFSIFFLYYDKVQQDMNFLAAKKAMVDLTPLKVLNNPFSRPTDEHLNPSNFTNKAPLNHWNLTLHDRANAPLSPSNMTLHGGDKSRSKAHLNPSDMTLHGGDKSRSKARTKCNIFDGRWVYKAEGGPRYTSFNCPFIKKKMRCQSNGRPDGEYEKWRWEPLHCDIPMFNGRNMLERLRNKRVNLVGDSLNNNMWESLVCLLYTSIASSTHKVDEPRGYNWELKEYNFTLKFFWSSFLVELNKQNVLVLDKLSSKHEKWIEADIVVFNTGHWWETLEQNKGVDLYEFQGEQTQAMQRELAYKRGLNTWATWIKKNVDPKITKVFFRSYSPVHNFRKYDQWCFNKTQPIMDNSYVPNLSRTMSKVVERVIKGMGNHVTYLNATKLSEYRIDAHLSMYTGSYEIDKYADCSHWCLPGVPDTWNRLLYVSLFFDIMEDRYA